MRKVLIADDEEPVRLAMRRLFVSAFGCEVIEVSDGVAALDALGAHDDLTMAVLDIGMPVISGLEVLEVIRDSADHSSLPVVLFTGTNDEHSARRAIEAGANDFLLKPFRLQHIRPRIESLLNMPRTRVARATGAALPHAGPVVVVDDSEDFQHMVTSTLALSHEVVTVPSGVAALELCRERPPFVVLIGPETGLLKGPLLARKIREAGCPDTVVVQVHDGDGETTDEAFDASLARTYVPETFMLAFRRCYEKRFSLTAEHLPAFTLVRRSAKSSAQQALGMLAKTDVSVSELEQAERRPGDLAACLTLTMWRNTVAIDMELRCSPEVAKQTAASVLGVDAERVTPEDAQSAVGELANIVAGRIQGIVARDFGPARFTIPKTAVDETGTATHVQLALRASATASDATFDLLMAARPLKVRPSGVKAA